MATIVDKDVGGGSNHYANLPAAVTALNAVNLVSLDQIWRFNVYPYGGGPNGEIQISSGLQIDVTADSTRYPWFRAAPGHGFSDHANKLTNAPRYAAANGVAINITANYTIGFSQNCNYLRISGLQLKSSAVESPSALIASLNTAPGLIEGCILENNSATLAVLSFCGAIVNTVAYNTNAAAAAILSFYNGTGSSRNNTLIGSGATAQAITSAAGNVEIRNTAVFQCAAFSDGNNGTCSNNASSLASVPGSSALTSLTYGSQFQSVTGGAEDWRPVGTGSLDGAGARDQTYTNDMDLVGQSRSTSTPTIGAWEYQAGGGGSLLVRQRAMSGGMQELRGGMRG